MPFQPDIHTHNSLPSTMDEARRMADAGAHEGTVVQAFEQTAGRGRFGNQWSSPAGNLYMTVIFRPKIETRYCAQMSFVVAVALASTLAGYSDVKMKWPNDVLMDGKKVAGILLEMQGQGSQPDYLLAGIGVNIGSAPDGSARCHNDTVDELRTKLLDNLGHWYDTWLQKGFVEVRKAWLSQVHGLHKPVTVRMAERRLEGVFEGIDDHGNLILGAEGGKQQVIASGDVHFRPS